MSIISVCLVSSSLSKSFSLMFHSLSDMYLFFGSFSKQGLYVLLSLVSFFSLSSKLDCSFVPNISISPPTRHLNIVKTHLFPGPRLCPVSLLSVIEFVRPCALSVWSYPYRLNCVVPISIAVPSWSLSRAVKLRSNHSNISDNKCSIDWMLSTQT